MTTDPLGRPDRLQVTVAPAGWRGVLIRPDGHTVGTCRHSHPSTLEARQCAEWERQLPGLTDLGFRLRALREAAGLSQAQAADALECSDSKVSRIETGEVLASTRDVRDLASLYRVAPAERDQLVTAARKGRAARNRGQDPARPTRAAPGERRPGPYAALLGLRRRSPSRPPPLPARASLLGPGGRARTRNPAKDGRAPHRQPPTSPPHKEEPMGTPTLPPTPARAAAGAALLDQRRPGWHLQVEPDRLDLEDWRSDILGQLYGSFGAGVHKLTGGRSEAEVDAWIVAHGFDLDEVDLGLSAGPRAAYQALTEAWRAELAHRRGGVGR